MGLHTQMNDVSSDSIPLLLVALIANCVNHLRTILFGLLHTLGLSRPFDSDIVIVDDGLSSAVGSGLTGLIVLTDQLNLNRLFSYRYSEDQHRHNHNDASNCVVCLCTLKDGDQVRMLSCRHVFHKHCFDGWLDHLNFNCPLCRSPLVTDERVAITRQRVGGDLLAWLSAQWNFHFFLIFFFCISYCRWGRRRRRTTKRRRSPPQIITMVAGGLYKYIYIFFVFTSFYYFSRDDGQFWLWTFCFYGFSFL